MSNRIPEDEWKVAHEQHLKELNEQLHEAVSSHSKKLIIEELAPTEVVKVLHSSKMRGWCPNPAHKQKSGQAFRFYDNVDQYGSCVCNTCGSFTTIYKTLEFVNGWDMATVFRELKAYFGIKYDVARVFELCGRTYTPSTGKTPKTEERAKKREFVPPEAAPIRDCSKAREKLNKKHSLLKKTSDLEARRIASNYFKSRGLDADYCIKVLGGALLVNPNEPYFVEVDKKTNRYQQLGKHPTLFMTYVDQHGHPVTFHRHYLGENGNGKAKIKYLGNLQDAKKSMTPSGEMKGGYMPCGAGPKYEGKVLGVAEGLETTLAGVQITGIPSRAASAGLLKFIHIPESVEVVVHFCDPDLAGLNDGDELKARCEERGITYIRETPPPLPDFEGTPDWCDAVKHLGAKASSAFMQCLRNTGLTFVNTN